MKQTITITGRLPSLNDFIGAMNRNKFVGAKLKRDTETFIGLCIRNSRAQPVQHPCRITFQWVEENKRRDLDNIYSAKKYILDALQTCGVLPNDNQKWVVDLVDVHPTIAKVGGCVVVIEECEEGRAVQWKK